MTSGYEYSFHIDAFTPATIPMARLAEYMADLAALFSEPASVHFARLEEGSTVLVQRIEVAAFPRVHARLQAIQRGEATADAVRAFASLDRRLAQDNAIALLRGENNTEAIRFPGRERPKPLHYGSFRQHGSLDGILVRIGGKDESVHATLKDGDQTWRCELTRAMTKEMRGHLYEKPLRVYGEGRWRRDPQGKWTLEQFRISQFEVLDDTPWPETIARLRAIEGAPPEPRSEG
ncbi:MAG: hypothetical protein GVY13_01980 [Alphaproteobacteria bacterium]|jgi:hypothetical protein|nr:hypothetical protein [Alphaproteobacteria bacterium]